MNIIKFEQVNNIKTNIDYDFIYKNNFFQYLFKIIYEENNKIIEQILERAFLKWNVKINLEKRNFKNEFNSIDFSLKISKKKLIHIIIIRNLFGGRLRTSNILCGLSKYSEHLDFDEIAKKEVSDISFVLSKIFPKEKKQNIIEKSHFTAKDIEYFSPFMEILKEKEQLLKIDEKLGSDYLFFLVVEIFNKNYLLKSMFKTNNELEIEDLKEYLRLNYKI